MKWPVFLDRVYAMLNAPDDATLASKWDDIVTSIRAAPEPPYHLTLAVREFDRLRGSKSREEFRILDHGCGPGSAIIWLAAIGFTNSRGVDVGGDLHLQNRWARVALGHSDDRFAIYDGTKLPVADRSIDAIISHQVLEHVPDLQYEAYYSEEGRVLVNGGIVLAQVPHRLVPYDSHSRTWLLHMLPVKVARRVMPIVRREWPDHLHLRWPWNHTAMTHRFIGRVTNYSATRLVDLVTIDHYDGPKGLRLIIGGACRLPLVGRSVANLLSQFVLMETIATHEIQPTHVARMRSR
jgi:SAM-dependent methyltransferase